MRSMEVARRVMYCSNGYTHIHATIAGDSYLISTMIFGGSQSGTILSYLVGDLRPLPGRRTRKMDYVTGSKHLVKLLFGQVEMFGNSILVWNWDDELLMIDKHTSVVREVFTSFYHEVLTSKLVASNSCLTV